MNERIINPSISQLADHNNDQYDFTSPLRHIGEGSVDGECIGVYCCFFIGSPKMVVFWHIFFTFFHIVHGLFVVGLQLMKSLRQHTFSVTLITYIIE